MADSLEQHYRIVRRPRVTEKGLKLVERHRAYPFEVTRTANKIEIRKAVEAIFEVKVEKVCTANMIGKRKRVGTGSRRLYENNQGCLYRFFPL